MCTLYEAYTAVRVFLANSRVQANKVPDGALSRLGTWLIRHNAKAQHGLYMLFMSLSCMSWLMWTVQAKRNSVAGDDLGSEGEPVCSVRRVA